MDLKETKGKKLIKCPHCREYLMAVDPSVLVEVYRAKKGKGFKPVQGLEAHVCVSCEGKVGIVLIQSEGG
jgi:hypothetical protein